MGLVLATRLSAAGVVLHLHQIVAGGADLPARTSTSFASDLEKKSVIVIIKVKDKSQYLNINIAGFSN